MKKKLIPIGWFCSMCLLFLFIVNSCKKEDPGPLDLLDRLNAIPGLYAEEIEPHYGYPRAFQIDFEQPVDHLNPDGAKFMQRIYLSHSNEETPMIFGPSGYGASSKSVQEIAGIMCKDDETRETECLVYCCSQQFPIHVIISTRLNKKEVRFLTSLQLVD